MSSNRQIIFFDGVCNLCNGFVDFLLKRDLDQLFDFSPLQGETAKRMLPPERVQKLDSVALVSQGEIFIKSDAALKVLQQLGGAWVLAKVLWIFPRWSRDLVYDFIVLNRYRFFGKRETCRLPTPEERARFLD